MKAPTMQTIPDDVLQTIRSHRPHLGGIIDNLATHPAQARQLEKALAIAYLSGETRLAGTELYRLSRCTVGQSY